VGVASEAGSAAPIDVDLTPFSLGKPPLWSRAWFIPLELYAWFFVLLFMAILGGDRFPPLVWLAGLLALATVALIAVGFVSMLMQRASSSTTGRKIAFLRPQDAGATAPGFERPMGEIIQALAARRSRRPGPPPRLGLHALAYYAGGAAVIVIGLPLFLAMRLSGVLPIMLLVGTSILLLTRGRRVQLRSADAVLTDDPRPPILFLRSFKDDQIKLMQRVRLAGLEPEQRIRFEEALGFMVGDFGPFLAVGEPGEGLPQLGAARAYLSDDAWQAQVLSWIAQSQVIAMLCGPTRWVHWEMKNIVAAGQLQRLLLFLPPGRRPASQAERRRIERWDNIVRSLEDTAYGPAMRALNIDDVLLILFRPGDQLMVFRSQGDAVQDYELAANLALQAILDSEAPRPVPTLAAAPAATVEPPPPPARPMTLDRLVLAKLAGVGAVEGLLGYLVSVLNPRLAGLAGIVLFPAAMGLGVWLFVSRDRRVWGWTAGLLVAAGLAGVVAAAVASGVMLRMGDPGLMRMFWPILGLTWPVFVLSALALRFPGFRDPILWAAAVGAVLVLGVAGVAIGRGPGVALVRMISSAAMAAVVGYGLSRSSRLR
jgi:hypothetical protein